MAVVRERAGGEEVYGGDGAAQGGVISELTATEARRQARAESLALASAPNKAGFKGVYCRKGAFRVDYMKDGCRHNLGSFSKAEAAAMVYTRHAREANTARLRVKAPLL